MMSKKEMPRDEYVYKLICDAINIIDEIDSLIATQSIANQKIDQEIQDWLHYIENNELTDSESIIVIKKLKELRIERRSLRNEYEIEKVYKDNSSKMMGNNTRGLLKAEIHKIMKQLDSEYKNRVLTDEQIKQVLEPTKKKVGRPKKESKGE